MFEGRTRKLYALGLITVLLVALVAVAAVGCGSSSTTTTVSAESTTASTAATVTTTAPAASSSTTAASTTGTTVAVGKLKIFFATPYYAGLGSGREGSDTFVQYARDKGWDVTIQDGQGNYQTIISDVEADIAQKADAIVLGGVPFNLAGTAYSDAYAAKIPVFVLDGQVTDQQVGAAGYDSVNDQTKAAEYFATAINHTGNVVVVTQTDDYQIDLQSKATLAVLAKYPDIKIIQNVKPDHKNDVDALKTIMTALLTSHPTPGSIAGGIAVWGDPAVGMAQAAEAMKRYEVKVVGFGASDAELEQMLLPQPVEIGSMVKLAPPISIALVNMIQAYFDGSNKTMGQNVLIPSQWITAGSQEAKDRQAFYKNYNANGFAALTTTTAAP